MAKKIKFPLEMKDGYKVRTMEELHTHSDVESIIEYFFNGKLRNWLKDRHYEEEVNAIDELEISNDNLIERIYSILHLKKVNDDNTNKVEKIIRREKIRSQINKYTDDEEILNNIDCVATSQEELESILKEKSTIVYLLGEKFMLFDNMKDIIIKGINNPEIIVNSKEVIDFKERQVYFENCHFDLEYEALIKKKCLEEENSHRKKKNNYKASNIFDYLLSDTDRNESAKIFDEIQNNLQNFEFDIDKGSKEIFKLLEDAYIQHKFNIDKYGMEIKSVIKNSNIEDWGHKFFDKIL